MMDNFAKPQEKAAASMSVAQYLTFQLAGQLYGVEILRVQEIKGWEKPTRLPHSPEYVQGEAEDGRTTVVIVVKVETARGEMTAGMVVDGVCEVCNIGAQDLRAPPELAAAIDTDFVRGLAMVDEKMLILLDAARLVGSTLAESPSGMKAA
jgi:purine-binding chemotaxis protein CheW